MNFKMNFKKILTYIVLIIPLTVTSCSFVKPINLNKITKSKQIKTPIPKKSLDSIVNNNIGPTSIEPSFGGKTFYDYKIIDLEENNNTIKLYLYLAGQEYYIENDKLTMGTGGVDFAIAIIKNENNNYKLLNYTIGNSPSQKEALKIFSKSIRKKAIKMNDQYCYNNPPWEKIQKDAETYFKKTKDKN